MAGDADDGSVITAATGSAKGSLVRNGKALIGDIVRYGGRRLGAAVVLMLAGVVVEGVGLALLVPIFSLLAPQTGGHWRALVVDALSSIGLVTQAILMILLSLVVALLMIGLALLGLLVLIPLSRRAADVGMSNTRSAFRIAGETAHFLGGLKIAVAHGMADIFVAQIG